MKRAWSILAGLAVVSAAVFTVRLDLWSSGTKPAAQLASATGAVCALAATLAGIVAAFIPTSDIANVRTFETKMALGVVVPITIGWVLYRRSARRYHETP